MSNRALVVTIVAGAVLFVGALVRLFSLLYSPPSPETFPVKDCYSLYETDLAIQTLFPDNSSGKITAARIRHVASMLAHQCK